MLDFGAAAAGATHLRLIRTGIVYCRPTLYGFTTDGVLVLAANPEQSDLFRVARPDADTLALTNVHGQESVFAALVLPDSMQCREMPIVARHDLPVDADYETGLAYDGSRLWFTGRGQAALIPVDPETGAIDAPRDVSFIAAPLVHGAQGADLWRTSWGENGPGPSVFRVDPGEEAIDKVDTIELGVPLEVRCLAYDAGTGTLLLHGTDAFVRIDAEAEPDRVIGSTSLPFQQVAALAWLGPQLFAIGTSSPVVLELDPETYRAIRTYGELDPELNARGIAAAGDRLFVLAQRSRSSQAVIVEVAP